MKIASGKIALFLLLFFSAPCFGMLPEGPGADKTVGKIITKAEADQLFGPVLQSASLPASEVKNFVNGTRNYVMFNLKNGVVFILDDSRSVLYPAGAAVLASEPFHKYSKSKVLELLSQMGGSEVRFEVRSNVFSITGDNYTLEFSILCPPICD